MSETEDSLTAVLQRLHFGDTEAVASLMEVVHLQLREIAANLMRKEADDHTLQPSALVNEAFIRLFGKGATSDAVHWRNRRHFFAAAAETMRRVLVDHARKRNSLKRGGERVSEELAEHHLQIHSDPQTLIRIHEALELLAHDDKLAAEIVRLRYFLGLSNDEISEVLELSRTSVYEHWSFARAWLIHYIGSHDNRSSS